MTLGEFRNQTKDLPDEILIYHFIPPTSVKRAGFYYSHLEEVENGQYVHQPNTMIDRHQHVRLHPDFNEPWIELKY
jgi:hypothetical protein